MRDVAFIAMAGGVALLMSGVLVATHNAQEPVFETVVPKPGAGPAGLGNTTPGAGRSGDITGLTLSPGEIARLPVLASDGEHIGRIVRVTEEPGGEIKWILVETDSFLGLGSRVVKIYPAMFKVGNGRIRIALSSSEIDRLPEVADGTR